MFLQECLVFNNLEDNVNVIFFNLVCFNLVLKTALDTHFLNVIFDIWLL